MLEKVDNKSGSRSPVVVAQSNSATKTDENDGEIAEEEVEEEDDLEAMMREFREKEKHCISESAPIVEKQDEVEKKSSLSFLMDSYGEGKKRMR